MPEVPSGSVYKLLSSDNCHHVLNIALNTHDISHSSLLPSLPLLQQPQQRKPPLHHPTPRTTLQPTIRPPPLPQPYPDLTRKHHAIATRSAPLRIVLATRQHTLLDTIRREARDLPSRGIDVLLATVFLAAAVDDGAGTLAAYGLDGRQRERDVRVCFGCGCCAGGGGEREGVGSVERGAEGCCACCDTTVRCVRRVLRQRRGDGTCSAVCAFLFSTCRAPPIAPPSMPATSTKTRTQQSIHVREMWKPDCRLGAVDVFPMSSSTPRGGISSPAWLVYAGAGG